MSRWARPPGLPVLCAAIMLVFGALTGCAARAGTNTDSAKGGTSGASGIDTVGTTRWHGSSGPRVAMVHGTTLAGQPLATGPLQHEVVVINVWASWCYPCRSESPALATVARATAGKGIAFVGVDEQDTSAAAKHFAASVRATYPSVVDSDGRILAGLMIVPPDAIPSTLILLPDGHVAARIIGPATAAGLLALLRPLEKSV